MPTIKPNKNWLSKSTYLRSMQCQKSFYLYKHHYRLRDKPSPEQQARFDRGHRVGHLAQLLFPGGIDVKPKSPRGWPKAIQTTSLLVANRQPIIYEAAFAYDGVMCAVDILQYKNGKFDVYEVKSSPGIRQVYIEDMALQYYVLNRQGIDIGEFYLMLPKKPQDGYTDLTMHDMDVVNHTEVVAEMELEVGERILQAKRTMELDEPPSIDMSDHCHKPYPCDFQSVCLGKKS